MKVSIFEVGPRDGLQNESQTVPENIKLEFIQLLKKAGHTNIEFGAFVNPKKVPQMSGSDTLAKNLARERKAQMWALVPNLRGFEMAQAQGVKNIAVFTAASNTFNEKNIGTDIAGSLKRFEDFVPLAQKKGMKVRGYVSTCFGCPYEGDIKPGAVIKVTEKLLKMGIKDISIGDTIGVAGPKQVTLLSRSLLKRVKAKNLALHLHDTRGTALANILAGMNEGIRIFDSSAGGLGGCPYAPGASGNVATEDLLYMLNKMGISTGISLEKHLAASRFIQGHLGRPLPARMLKV